MRFFAAARLNPLAWLGTRYVCAGKYPAAKRVYRSLAFGLTALLLLICAPLGAQFPTTNAAKPIQPPASPPGTSINFQGLLDHSPTDWPTVPFNTLRLWDSNTRWATLNPAQGTYDWKSLDQWLNAAEQHQVELLFTVAMTPPWASSDPNDQRCHYGPGLCDPPIGLNPDGTGSNQVWKDFITAVAQHINGRIKYWEIWNEPHMKFYWNGTPAQMVRMAQDARDIILSVDPTAKLLNAGVQSHYPPALRWWNKYAAAGGLKYADIIAMHGDVRTLPNECGVYPQAETYLLVMSNLHQVLRQYGEDNKPIWDTESSWARTDLDCFHDEDLHAAFLARFHLMHLSAGVRRFYWRCWIGGNGGLYDKNTGITKAGVAYGVIHTWITGRSLVNPCTATLTVWTCNFTGTNNYVAQAIWDTSQSCNNGVCTTVDQAVDPQFTHYRTLDGDRLGIKNNTVPIGAKPIWLEN